MTFSRARVESVVSHRDRRRTAEVLEKRGFHCETRVSAVARNSGQNIVDKRVEYIASKPKLVSMLI